MTRQLIMSLAKNIAVVLGGTHYHIALIGKLAQRGYATVLIDYFEDPPAKHSADIYIRESTLNKEEVLRIAQKFQARIVITACIDQALLTMAYVCEQLGLPCHLSYEQALRLTNKAKMKEVFYENEIPTSKYAVIETVSSAIEVPASCRYPLVVKPADANSSKGIRKVENAEELQEAVTEAFGFSRSHRVVVEEFVNGVELSVDAVVKDRKAHIVLVTENRKHLNNKYNFTIVQNVYRPGVFNQYQHDLKTIAESIAGAFQIHDGPLLIQLLANGDNLSVIEFSSRFGGGSKHQLISKVSHLDVLEYYIDLLLKKPYAIDFRVGHECAAVNYMYAKPGKACSYSGLEELKAQDIVEEFFLYKNLGAITDRALYSSDRPAGAMIVGRSESELQRKVRVFDQRLKILDENNEDIMIHGLY